MKYDIPPGGLVLERDRLYLAHTIERLGGDCYAPTFAARSSVARLGIFINLSASLGDVGFVGQWTLQLYTAHRVRVFTGMAIGQMMWWQVAGDASPYRGKYQHSMGPRSSEIHQDFARKRARVLLPQLGSATEPTEVGMVFASLSTLEPSGTASSGFAVPRSLLAAETRANHESRAGLVPSLSEPTRLLIQAAADNLSGDGHATGFSVWSSPMDISPSSPPLVVHGLPTAAEVIDAIEQLWHSAPCAAIVVNRSRSEHHGFPIAEWNRKGGLPQ